MDKSTYTVSVMMSLLQLEDSVVEYLMLLVSLVQSVLMLVSLVFNQFCYHNILVTIFSQFSTCTDHYKQRYSNNRTKLLSHMYSSWGGLSCNISVAEKQ